MKTLAGLLCAAAVLLGQASAQGANTAAIEKQLVANERAINDAVVKHDVKAFRTLVSPDGVSVDMMGMTKVADFEKMIAEMKITSFNIEMPRVIWLTPDAAIVAYTWTGKGTWQGQSIPSPTYASTSWAKQPDGKWLARFHQETMAMPSKPATK